jgi:tetratricopeptide (TPR) repeat protein
VVFDILNLKMSQKKQSDTAEVIVTSDTVRSNKHLSKRFLYMVSTGIVLVFLIIAGVLLVDNLSKSTASVKQNQTKKISVTQQAIDKAQTELKDASSPQAKSTAYSNLGAAYLSNNQATQAISSYQSAKPNTSNQLGISIGLGYAYSMTGQNSQAISAFQQVIALLEQSTNQYEQGKISTYQNLVQRLQQGEPI